MIGAEPPPSGRVTAGVAVFVTVTSLFGEGGGGGVDVKVTVAFPEAFLQNGSVCTSSHPFG